MILHILSIKRGNRCCCRCCLRSDSISAGWTHNSGTVFSFEQQSMPQTKQQAACCDLTKTDGPSSVELAETPLSSDPARRPSRPGLACWLVACQSHQINNRERPAACTKIKEWQLKIAKASNADGCATPSPSLTQQERAKSRRGKRR